MTTFRVATTADAAGILAIYAPYIQNTSFTFETEVPTLEKFQERIKTYLDKWPWLVCEVNGIIAGYAYASGYRERVAYQWSVECSVYLHDDFQQTGIAKKLYTALFALLQLQGFHNVYAVINLPNDKSVRFHEKFGFHWFANYEQVGYKLGQWKTVGWWRLTVNEFITNPPAPLKFAAVEEHDIATVLSKL